MTARSFVMRPLPMPVITVTNGSGADPMNVANDYMGVVWTSANNAGGKTMTVDLGASPGAVDTVLMFGCTGIPVGTTMAVEAADDSGFTTNYFISAAAIFIAGATFPVHGRAVGYWERAAGPLTRRYWRFTFDTGVSSAVMTIARVAMGSKLQLAREFSFGGAWGVRDLGSVDWSPAGVLLRRTAAKLRTIGLTYSNVYKDEVETKVQPLLQQRAGQQPIVLVTDATVDTLRQTRCWFGPLIGDLGTIWRTAAGWEWRANLVDLVPIPKDVI